jgi:hypothetical protein
MSQPLLLTYTQSCCWGDDSNVKPTEGRMINRTACTLRCSSTGVTVTDSMPHPDCTQYQAGVFGNQNCARNAACTTGKMHLGMSVA